jgi:hypothetical protein
MVIMPTVPAVPGALSPRVQEFLQHKRSARARLVFGLDATASREWGWDVSMKSTGDMFAAAAGLGALDVQLVYYRGYGECVASRWMTDAHALATIMSTVTCRAGETQIRKVLAHARKTHQQQKVDALVFVSDACEEPAEALYAEARELGAPVFLFQEGNDRHVAEVYAELARITHGAHIEFNAGAAQRLTELLRAVVAFATGGTKALAAEKTQAATLLLQQMK